MSDIYGKIVSIIAGVLFMTLVPLMLVMQNFDRVTQSYAETAVSSFKNICVSEGRITDEAYYKLLNDLAVTGYSYDIDITCYSKESYTSKEILVQADNGHDVVRLGSQSGIATTYITIQFEEILDAITAHIGDTRSEYAYQMKKGDYIKIQITSNNDTIGTKILSVLTLGAMKPQSIQVVDSGRVEAATHK